MTDFNVNAKLSVSGSINGFARENQVKPLQNSQKPVVNDGLGKKNPLEKRQEIASNNPLDTFKHYNIKKLPKEELDNTISQLNDSLQNVQRNLEFSIDKDVGKIVINVKDKETDEVVRQIPSEEVLELAKNLHELSERLNKRSESHSQHAADGVFLKIKV